MSTLKAGFICLIALAVANEGAGLHRGQGQGAKTGLAASIAQAGQYAEDFIEYVEVSAVEAVEDQVGLEDKEDALVVIGGSVTNKTVLGVTVNNFVNSTLADFPTLRFAGVGCRLSDTMLMVCGGRESLLNINTDCWIYHRDKDEWMAGPSLPISVAGAAHVCLRGEGAGARAKILLLGGVVEEDYYQDDSESHLDQYDYSTEVPTNLILEYTLEEDDKQKQEWHVAGYLPKPLYGACAVVVEKYILLIGGRDSQSCGQGCRTVLVYNMENKTWREGPRLNRARYYHGCSKGELQGSQSGIVVAGGLGPHNIGDSVEFLAWDGSSELANAAWRVVESLPHPHPHSPVVGWVGESRLVVMGGADGSTRAVSGGVDMAEVWNGDHWQSFHLPGSERSFGIKIEVPTDWLGEYLMEPNYGLHPLHRKITRDHLTSRNWLCHGNRLVTSEETESSNKRNISCTIPGCQYGGPGLYTKSAALRGKYSCSVETNVVQCTVKCKRGFEPLNRQDTLSCFRGQPFPRNRYLECIRV